MIFSRTGSRFTLFVVLLGTIITLAVSSLSDTSADVPGRISTDTHETTVEVLEPQSPATDSNEAPLSEEKLLDLQKEYYERREGMDAAAVAEDPAAAGDAAAYSEVAEVAVPETRAAVAADFHGTPSQLHVGRKKRNTVAPVSPSFISTLGEPAVAQWGKRVFYTGNTFASFSTNRGKTWTDRPFPTPLNAGDFMCCDQDVEYSLSRNRFFWSLLYLNGAVTRGVVTIAVLKNPAEAPLCRYDFEYGDTTIPDYPHIGLSNDFLYLSTNNVDVIANAWTGSQMKRIALDEIADCSSITVSTFTWNSGSQRVFVPVEGATDRMFWGILETDGGQGFRVFEWKETSASVTSSFRSISTSVVVNPDCRGGVNNADFIERSTAWSQTGFRMRGWTGQPGLGGGQDAIGFLWNVGDDTAHPQGHIHGAVFDVDTKDLLAGSAGQPHIWNSNFCFGFPDVATTQRGHPGIILAWGGKAGGGGKAARVAVLLGDDVPSLAGPPFGSFKTILKGTHNRSDGRFGDYLTIQRYEPCGYYFSIAGYAFRDGTASANVYHRYADFGRRRDKPCYDKVRGKR